MEKVNDASLSKGIRISSAVFLIMILVVLAPTWVLIPIPYIQRNVPSNVYAVPILDSTLYFPLFGITVVKLLQQKPIANLLAGIMLIKTVTVCLSWGFAEWRSTVVDYPMAIISSLLTVVSLILFIIYIFKLEDKVES